jgi:two-component system, NarL family, response regulator
MIKLLLVEDDEVFRIGLTVSLKKANDMELVGTAEDGKTAITLTELHQPDLVLMDIGLPVLNGIEVTRAIKEKYPDIRVLVLTSHSDPKLVEQIMEAGADGYCLKGISTERLQSLIQEVYQGIFWIDAAVADQIKKHFQSSQKPSDIASPVNIALDTIETLTEREKEVLALIAAGKKNQDIAESLCISPGTVRVHVHSILNKLNVKDRTQAALFVMQQKQKEH